VEAAAKEAKGVGGTHTSVDVGELVGNSDPIEQKPLLEELQVLLREFSASTQRWFRSGRHLEVEGRSVFVRELGEGPDLLLIHGFPTSSFDWQVVTELLSQHFHCVSLDFLGFGLSDKPEAYSYSLFQQTDLVERIVEMMGISEVHVLSHDMGTSSHTELLAREQEQRLGFRIASSTFLNGSLLKDKATLIGFQRMLEDPQRLPEAIEFCAKMVPAYVSGLKRLMARPEVVSDEDAQVMTELLLYQDGNQRLPNVYAYVRERYLHKERWIGALESTPSPVQLVWGSDDPVANVAMGRALRNMLPRAHYTELPGIGHFVPLEAPEEVASAIRRIAGVE